LVASSKCNNIDYILGIFVVAAVVVDLLKELDCDLLNGVGVNEEVGVDLTISLSKSYR
jgi:hypothetical protein